MQVPGADSAIGLDNKNASLLSFGGATRVHGLYNWLLDSTTLQSAEGTDVPQLLAPTIFLGASLQTVQPQVDFTLSSNTYLPSSENCKA